MLAKVRGSEMPLPLEALPFVSRAIPPGTERAIEASRRRRVHAWLSNPQQMFNELAKAYQNVLALCPENSVGLNIVSEDDFEKPSYEVLTQIKILIYAKRMELARFSTPSLPMTSEVLLQVVHAARHPIPHRLTHAMQDWKKSLIDLEAWVKQFGATSPAAPCPELEVVTVRDIAKRLAEVGREISTKRLNNHYKKEWGSPEGKKGNACTFKWAIVRSVIERQCGVRFEK